MMAARDTIKIFITGDASGFKKAAGEVESTGKKLSGLAKTAIAGGIAAGGAAALKAIGNYTKLADTVRNFSTVTGLSAVESSKAIEAFGDLGVESSTLQSSIAKFNKTLGKSGVDAFKKYGVSASRAADGTVDVNKTFINAIKAIAKIEDPFLRAAAAQDMFKRSWEDLAPLIPFADELAQRVDAVGEGQIITEKELAKQQRFKESLDQLKDKVSILGNQFAEKALPVLSKFADFLVRVPPNVLLLGAGILVAAAAFSKLGSALSGIPALMTLISTHPLILGLAALALAVYAVYKNWDKIAGAIGKAADALARFLGLDKNTSRAATTPAGNTVANVPRPAGPPGPGSLTSQLARNGTFTVPLSNTGTTIVNQNVTVQAANPYDLSKQLARTATQGQRAAGK